VATRPKTFVLLHGAWHGGWCWERVASALRARGHRVTTPTQTGLGERAHLMSPDIDLELFTTDLVNHLLWEGLSDVTLVGHSFGGNAITGVADQVPERIARLIFLDALVPVSGRSPFDDYPPDVIAERTRQARHSSGGVSIPAPAASAFGVTRPEDAAWLESRLTPHPLNTFNTALNFRGAPGNGLPAEFILCVDPVYGNIQDSLSRAQDHGWPVREIATAHDAMVTAPGALTDLLETEP
jgi:pimeloyl-ACP methyl ester carboxylesterase